MTVHENSSYLQSVELQKHQFESDKHRSRVRQLARQALKMPGVLSTYQYYLTYNRLRQELQPAIRNLNKQYDLKTMKNMEGYISTEQADWLQRFLSIHPEIKNIGQTGFNGGHSAVTILEARQNIRLTSFDIVEHSYVDKAEQYIDQSYPMRHQLVRGDSKMSIPAFMSDNPMEQFDCVFIDGGHDPETAYVDIQNFRDCTLESGLVIMDDYLPDQDFGEGPVAAWKQAINDGLIDQLDIITSSDNKRAWALGRYR